MKVAIYSRYSTDSQDKTSIAGQIANCEALAAREGFDVVARFQDAGRSGNDNRRDGYQALLKAMKAGQFSGIVTDESSRITRDSAELHRLVAELRFRDNFLLTGDGVDTRSETSELILAVKGAIDAMEGRKVGYRTYRSLRERHRDGHSAGGRIYGYSSVEDGDYRRRVIDPEQAEVVREIFERYAAGESGKVIARDLNARGVPSPGSYWNNVKRRSLGWAHTTILGSYTKASGILRNPIYVGQHTWNKRKGKKVPGTAQRIQKRRAEAEWITVQDETLRIVTDATWEAVQARLMKARAKAHPNNKGGRPPRYLLSGLMHCADCGCAYILRNGRDYACSSHSNGRAAVCGQRRTLNRSRVESALLEGVKAELSKPKTVRELSKRVRATLRKLKRPDKGALQAELGRVSTQLERVVDTLATVGQSEALTERLRRLEAERASLRAQLAAEAAPPELVPNVEKHIKGLIAGLEGIPKNPHADSALMEKARASVRMFVGDVKIVEEGGHVYADVEIGRACITAGAEERT